MQVLDHLAAMKDGCTVDAGVLNCVRRVHAQMRAA